MSYRLKTREMMLDLEACVVVDSLELVMEGLLEMTLAGAVLEKTSDGDAIGSDPWSTFDIRSTVHLLRCSSRGSTSRLMTLV